MEQRIGKMNKIVGSKMKDFSKISSTEVSSALKTKKTVEVKVGPNNVHDILDSLE